MAIRLYRLSVTGPRALAERVPRLAAALKRKGNGSVIASGVRESGYGWYSRDLRRESFGWATVIADLTQGDHKAAVKRIRAMGITVSVEHPRKGHWSSQESKYSKKGQWNNGGNVCPYCGVITRVWKAPIWTEEPCRSCNKLSPLEKFLAHARRAGAFGPDEDD